MTGFFRRGRRAVLVLVVLALSGPWASAGADDSPLPGSCKVHPNKVLNPGCVPAATGYDYTFPDLSPDVTQVRAGYDTVSFNPDTNEFTYGPPVLFFDTYARNLGTVAVDLQSEEATNLENPPASQCVAWTANVCRERVIVGGFEVHPTHNHIHFEDFAAYEMRRFAADGSVDWSDTGLIDVSDKVSFCLVDSASLTTPNLVAPVPTYLTCTGLREGISPGWTDVYTSDLEGQQLQLGNIADGRYALVVSMNTAGNLYETTRANNRVIVTVELTNLSDGELRSATIVDRTWTTG